MVSLYLTHKATKALAKKLYFFCLIFCSLNLIAQIPDNQCTGVNIFTGGLKLTDEAGCVPLKITAFNTIKGNTNLQYIFDYRGGSPYTTAYKPTQDSVFTFSKTGTYIVIQLSKKDGAELRACKLVTVQDTTLPVFNIQICSDGNVTLTLPRVAANNYDDFGIDWGDGKVEIIANQTTKVTHKYSDENTKRVSVQGIHKLGKCGGKSIKAIIPVVSQEAAVITKLTITGPNTAEITVKNPNEIPLILYRQDAGGDYKDIGKSFKLQNETTKILVDSNTINCFKLRPADTCAAKVESNILCTAYIKATNDVDKNIVAITPYLLPSAITKQIITKNNTVWKNPSRVEFIFEDPNPACGQQTCYRLQIDTKQGTILSNIACIGPPLALCNQLGNVYIPDAFSPNEDGVNDVFELKGDIPRNYELTIFDKWGRAIFQSKSYTTSWNGSENGFASPTGSYFYHLIMKDKAGLSFEKRGVVLLIR